jgi:methylmalonyl-CoA/ethylmalonyl-CoA epimerase
MSFTQRFDHVGVAVRDAEEAGFLFSDILGGEYAGRWEVAEEGFRFAHYRFPSFVTVKLELLEPTEEEGGFLPRFLDRSGEGVHHLSFRVTDIERRLDHLRAHGIEPVHVVLNGQWKEAFIHPRQASGVLIQLLEVPQDRPPSSHAQ